MRFADLFCGIGGFRLALERRGHECVFSCDINKYSRAVYRRVFKEEPQGDVVNIAGSSVPDHDILCAGFPCQAFATCGKREGFADARGEVFFELMRIIRAKRPKILLLENVPGLLMGICKDYFARIREEIESAGYDFHYSVLKASDFGHAQVRERIYFVCFRRPALLKYTEPTPTGMRAVVEDILMDGAFPELIINRNFVWERKITRRRYEIMRIAYYGKRASQSSSVYSPKGLGVAVTTKGGGHYFINGKVRKLHPIEIKRLMGYPDEYPVSTGRQGILQLGNAVIPYMIGKVFDGIQ